MDGLELLTGTVVPETLVVSGVVSDDEGIEVDGCFSRSVGDFGIFAERLVPGPSDVHHGSWTALDSHTFHLRLHFVGEFY